MNHIRSDWEIKDYCKDLCSYWSCEHTFTSYQDCKDQLRWEAAIETWKVIGENLAYISHALFQLSKNVVNELNTRLNTLDEITTKSLDKVTYEMKRQHVLKNIGSRTFKQGNLNKILIHPERLRKIFVNNTISLPAELPLSKSVLSKSIDLPTKFTSDYPHKLPDYLNEMAPSSLEEMAPSLPSNLSDSFERNSITEKGLKNLIISSHIGSAIGGILIIGSCVKIARHLKKEGLKKQWPLLATTVAGAALLGLSQLAANNTAQQAALGITAVTAGLVSGVAIGIFNFLFSANQKKA